MASNLPNELIREILYPSFDVPDEMLHDVSDVSPFFRPSYQPCYLLLLVCKRWMLVGMPLLYNTVVLRSRAQAYSLARTFRKNKALGALVEKLRIEDLGVSLDLRSSDGVKGLVSSLPSVNPSSLVILDPARREGKGNAQLRQLSEKLMMCFKDWSNLNQIFLPQVYNRSPIAEMMPVLAGTPTLQTIILPGRLVLINLHGVETLAKKHSLKNICLRFSEDDNLSSNHIADLDELCTHSSLRGLVTYELPPPAQRQPYVAHPSNPNYTSLENVTKDLYEKIWDHILRFAMQRDARPHKYFPKHAFTELYQARKTIPMVSKTFRRLSLPYKYRAAMCRGDNDLQILKRDMERDPSRGPQLQSIIYRPTTWAFGSKNAVHTCMELILSRALNLISISASYPARLGSRMPSFEAPLSITWSGIEALAIASGPNVVYLLDIVIPAPPSIQLPTAWSRFSALRKLSCTINTAFNTEVLRSPEWLPYLEVLKLRDCHSSFFNVLSYLTLPALRDLDIILFRKELPQVTTFLKTHGPKITTLVIEEQRLPIFELCPNVTQLTLMMPEFGQSDEYGMPDIKDKHHYLSKITFVLDNNDVISQISPPPDLDIITGVDYSFFPALKEIQISSLKWPITEFEISKSSWPDCSEVLASHGIQLTNREGMTWRPRLKYSRT